MKFKLALKVFLIIGTTLFVGFSIMGITTLLMVRTSTMHVQKDAAVESAGVIKIAVQQLMMKGDSRLISEFVDHLKKNMGVVDLNVFNKDGKITGTNGVADPQVLEAFTSGKTIQAEQGKGSGHMLVSIIPLPNEQRCKACHAEAGYTGAIKLTSSMANGYRILVNMATLLCILGGSCFVLIVGGMYLFFRLTIIKQIVEVSDQIMILSKGEGDLTVTLQVKSDDEIGILTTSVNLLITKLRGIITDLYDQAGQVAMTSCRTSVNIEHLASSIHEQKELAASVAVASEEISATLNDVAMKTAIASTRSKQVDASSREGQRVVAETVESIDQIRAGVEKTLGVMSRLHTSSSQIGEIVGLIQDVAEHTNLLALNAAIEAARAGEAGRGFAIVADEVKNLSNKTSSSTQQIGTHIKTIQDDIRKVMQSIEEEKVRVERGMVNANRASEQISTIMIYASESADLINSIAIATEEQSITTTSISSKIHMISNTSNDIQVEMEKTIDTFGELTKTAEIIYNTVGKFKVGNYHNTIKNYATELKERTTIALEQAVSAGRLNLTALFSTDYKPIPHTVPQKYSTPFDRLFDEIIAPIQEDILTRDKKMIYAICIDRSGYCPSHNRRYTQQLTGDVNIDKNHNRTKRIFNDRTGMRSATNKELFLLQTYLRDTGEVMNDMSTPIIIGDKHWGAVRIGYISEH